VRVALNAWFAGQPVGTGQYTDHLLASLRTLAPQDEFEPMTPSGPEGGGKLRFEQLDFPRAARAADLAHVPYWAPPLVPTVPTVVTVHDLIPLVLPPYRTDWRVRAYTALVARATGRAAAVIADSAHTAADIRRRLDVDERRLHVVPLGVDVPAGSLTVPRVAAPGGEPLVVGGQPLPPRYALYFGGFDIRKNVPMLLAAWRRVYAQTGVPLVIAGGLPEPDDPLKPHPAAVARDLGLPEEALRLVGPFPEPEKPALLARADVFAFPSRYEGFGLPPLEAMACGTPVVVADATSLPEVVGDAGLLVGPDDVDGWVAAVCLVLEDEQAARRLVDAGRSRAADFTWQRTAEATRRIYALLLA
jgi:glycosyltransferase involved in cell wall biosynthesis